MVVTLNISDDSKLRNYVKDMVKGQVMAITRTEFLEMIRIELDRKMKAVSDDYFDILLKSVMARAVKEALIEAGAIGRWTNDFMRPYITEILDERLKDINMEHLIKEEVQGDIRVMTFQLINKFIGGSDDPKS